MGATHLPAARPWVFGGLIASIAPQEALPFFNPQNGYEKEADIVVDALFMRLNQAAAGAMPGMFGDHGGFGLNAGDEKHGVPPFAKRPSLAIDLPIV
jgi:hypothetical protein